MYILLFSFILWYKNSRLIKKMICRWIENEVHSLKCKHQLWTEVYTVINISHVQLPLCAPRSPGWPWPPSLPPQPSGGPYWSSRPIAWCPSGRPVSTGGPGDPLGCAWAGPRANNTNIYIHLPLHELPVTKHRMRLLTVYRKEAVTFWDSSP